MEKDWVEVYLTAHEYRASIAIDLLENEGIKAILLNQHDTAYQSFGDYKVYVDQKDELQARELLKELKR